jgi:hypothetical protein
MLLVACHAAFLWMTLQSKAEEGADSYKIWWAKGVQPVCKQVNKR